MITKRELLKQLEHTECAVSEKFIELLDNFNEYELCDHRNFAGHITVSGMIVNITTRSILLLLDKILDKWILPEDHLNVEGESPISTVLRTIEQGLMYAEMYAGWEDGFLGEVSLFKRALDEVSIQE